MCCKIFVSSRDLVSTEKTKLKAPLFAKPIIPGFCQDSEVKIPVDNNLSPFIVLDSKTMQYGNTFLESVCTDDPAWSPGECLSLGKYEGRFRRKKSIECSLVFSVIFKYKCFEFKF